VNTSFSHTYVHGYNVHESRRLQAQAGSVVDLLHGDTRYSPGELVLEVGCGTGAQTISLARNSPATHFVSVDRSADSLAQARGRIAAAALSNVRFLHADLFALPFAAQTFDHIFVCFVLEHSAAPADALRLLGRLLKPGGSITVFEGDHGSTYFHPHSDIAQRAVHCQIELQRRAGGNACIGRQVYPLLVNAGFRDVRVSPRMVYVDASRPDLVDGFTRRTFTAMIEGVRQRALEAGLMDAASFDAGLRALSRTAAEDGVFCYTFFKGVACVG
jgi:SAM-dependent methyltransferase